MSRLAAVITAIGTIVGAWIGKSVEHQKVVESESEQQRIQHEFEDRAGRLATCDTRLLQCASDKRSLEVVDAQGASARSLLLQRVAAATSPGRRQEGDESGLFALGRSDWLALNLAGRSVTLTLEQVAEDAVVFRLAGCQDPPFAEGLSVSATGPHFQLNKSQPSQVLRLSGSCCSRPRSECDETTLQAFKIVLATLDSDMFRATVRLMAEE